MSDRFDLAAIFSNPKTLSLATADHALAKEFMTEAVILEVPAAFNMHRAWEHFKSLNATRFNGKIECAFTSITPDKRTAIPLVIAFSRPVIAEDLIPTIRETIDNELRLCAPEIEVFEYCVYESSENKYEEYNGYANRKNNGPN